MEKPTLIGPIPQTTPAGRMVGHTSRHDLPPDLLRDASRRLGLVSLITGALWLVGGVISHLTSRVPSHDHDHVNYLRMPDYISAGVVITSIALFVYSRKSKREPRFILDLGFGYLILISMALGQMFHWYPLPHVKITPMISWIGPLLLLFAAIMPTTPGKTLAAGLFAASMNPLGMFIAKARGNWDFGPNINVLLMHYPDYLLVAVSVVISHIFTGLGEQVSRAREMGSYRLGELLGRGGMGEVYKAHHRMLARPAAIKLIRREVIGEEGTERARSLMQRFRREAEVASNLRSPHTVALYDFGVTEDRTFYLVMELLDGMDLEVLIRDHGKLPPSRVVHLLLQVCASLEEAHARGLVHRDVKPANIHVGRVGLEYDFVKVLDFGLVKAIDGASDQVLHTAAGSMPGTPAYMPPEMALDGKIDGRTDLYALGCVAHYALTGELVFDASSAIQMMAKHVSEPPPAPSTRSEDVPPELDALVLSCLAKNIEQRPPSAAAVASALRAMDIAPWTQDEARAWWERPA